MPLNYFVHTEREERAVEVRQASFNPSTSSGQTEGQTEAGCPSLLMSYIKSLNVALIT